MKTARLLRAFALLAASWLFAGATIAATPSEQSPQAAPKTSAIPFKHDVHDSGTLAWQAIAGVVLAGLAAYGAVVGLKRAKTLGNKSGKPERRLHTVESKRVGRRGMLHVVTYREQELLLVENEQGLQVLSTMALPAASGTETDHV